MKHQVLLTGATGFVGKVILFSLLRRREELGIAGVTVLIRAKKSRNGSVQTPLERFTSGVAQAEIFRRLPAGWQEYVEVVGTELEQSDLGLTSADAHAIEARVTHVVHCAASVEFDLPVAAALRANVDAALNVLELARRCSRLVGMVSVSTAYVSVWRDGPILETLAHLPRPAVQLQRAIIDGTRTEAALLAESGHPNTYTYTKCLAEHLLSERRGSVPLMIVRPSIISAAWAEPEPGWIDSNAAFAGCLLYTGLGLVKAWEANPNVRLDVVPVDVVSQRVIDAAFSGDMPKLGQPVPIRLAAMGLHQAMRADMSTQATCRFFEERPGAKATPGTFIGGVKHGFLHQDLLRRALPVQGLRAYFALTGNKVQRRQLEKVNERVQRLNAAFRYFIHHSFDFRPSNPVALPGFTPVKYIQIVNRGMYRHLLRRDETELTLAGERHDDGRGDISWAVKRPGKSVIRGLGVALRKALRRCTTLVTFDRASFERAVAQVPPNHLFVLAPSHRSYFDFLLSSYLCFQHPELGIPVPQIAAAEEFSRIPVVSRILSRSGAFYVKRGVGKAVPEVGREVERIAAQSAALMFFIEGQRSRGRRVLPPKRGLLRALQATGRSFAVLPLAISYERVPEESAFDRELRGGKRSAMSLEAILRWLVCLARGQVQLGRIHIACGNPLTLDESTDVQALARNVAAELQRETVVTSFHLRMFLTHGLTEAGATGIDEDFLVEQVERRGGRVLRSETPLPRDPAPSLLQSLQNQWIHWFYADALLLFPEDRAVRDQVARHSWTALSAEAEVEDPRVRAVVRALFRPVIQAYELVTQHISDAPPALTAMGPLSMVQAHPAAYLPHLEDAFLALSERGLLHEVRPGYYAPADPSSAEWAVLEDNKLWDVAQNRVGISP